MLLVKGKGEAYLTLNIDIEEIIDDFATWYVARFSKLEDAKSVAAALICYAHMLHMDELPVKPAAKPENVTDELVLDRRQWVLNGRAIPLEVLVTERAEQAKRAEELKKLLCGESSILC